METLARRKISGRRCAPPTNSSVKNRKVKFWCIYTTTLELILAKMSDFDERLRAAVKRRLRLK
jgi:hypothetical protein